MVFIFRMLSRHFGFAEDWENFYLAPTLHCFSNSRWRLKQPMGTTRSAEIRLHCRLHRNQSHDEPNPTLGKTALSCPLGSTRCVVQESKVLFPCIKSFIDKASSVKTAGNWPRSFFWHVKWTSTPSRSINTQETTGLISSDLDRTIITHVYLS